LRPHGIVVSCHGEGEVDLNPREATALTRLLLFVLTAALAGVWTAAIAGPAPKPESQCFLSRNVNNFTAPDDRTVFIRVGVSDVYRLDLMATCPEITFRQSLALESLPGNPWICSPLDATVISRDVGIPLRCPVKAIQKLTKADVTALPKRDRP
jgi:hypothetical protein